MRLLPFFLLSAAFALPVSAAQKKVVFAQHVLPMLKNKCFKCHQEAKMDGGKLKKPKGGLRLDAAAAIVRGADSGAVVKPGNPKESPLFQVVMLPPEHDDVMPPKAPYLSKNEKIALALWIAQGAKFGSWRGNTSGLEEKAKVGGSDFSRDSFDTGIGGNLMEDLDKLGAKVTVTGKENLVGIEFVAQTLKVKDEQIAALKPIAPKIIELSLPRAQITDEALKTIGEMPRIYWLDIRGTSISDAGLAYLKDLSGLTYLNLYGTKITDQSVTHLSRMKRLEKLFLFGTEVTPGGVGKLKAALPKTQIIQ